MTHILFTKPHIITAKNQQKKPPTTANISIYNVI